MSHYRLPRIFHPTSKDPNGYEIWPDTRENVFRIPLEAVGVEPGYVVIPDDLSVAMEAPDGSRWTSVWQGAHMSRYLPADQYDNASVVMPSAVYNKWKGLPLTVHLRFALTQAKVDKVNRIPLPMHEFSVPDFGICSPLTNSMTSISGVEGLFCGAALREPQLTYISAVWSDTPCLAPQAELGGAWAGSLVRERAPNVVFPMSVHLSNNQKDERARYLCPDSTVSFTQYKLVRRPPGPRLLSAET